MTLASAATRFAVIIWVGYLVVVAFFHASSADEGGYHYQAVRIAAGQLPVLEMYTQMPVWAYLPFSAIAKWVSTNVEAMRLYSIAAVVAVVFMATTLIRRRYGGACAVIGFCLMAFSWPWVYANLEVRHSVSANLGLVSAFYFLFFFRSRPILTAFLAGLGMGLAINTRVVLIPVAVVAAILLYTHARRDRNRSVRIKCLAAAAGGVFVMSIPSFLILFADAEALFFNYLLARVDWAVMSGEIEIPQDGWSQVVWFVGTRVGALFQFFSGFSRSGMWQNLVLLVPILSALILTATRQPGRRCSAFRFLADEPMLRAAAWMVIAIIATHSLVDMITGKYFHHAIPFIVIAAVGVIHRTGFMAEDDKRWGRFSRRNLVWIPVFVALIPYFLWYAGFTVTDIVRRAEPSLTRPMTSARVACWLERHTPDDGIVMNYYGEPVAAAGRRLPKGFEQGQGVSILFWDRISQEKARRFNILTAEEYRRQLIAGEVPVVVYDYTIDRTVKRAFHDLPDIMAHQYRFVTTTGGAFPYEIYAHKNVDKSKLTVLPQVSGLGVDRETARRLLREGRYGKLLGDLARDVGHSLATLPGDLAGSIARAVGASFDARCGRLLRGSRPFLSRKQGGNPREISTGRPDR